MSIREIQQWLKDHGYDPGPIDGIDGPRTKAAVRAYQQANGLAVDGVAGPKTQAAMRGGAGTSAGAGTPAATPEQEFASKYPQFAWAVQDPDVANVLRTAVANKWGPDEVQGAIQNTNWWKSKTDSERNWLQLLATNPAEATRRLNNYDSITKYISLANAYGEKPSFQDAAGQIDRVVRGEVAPDALQEELRIRAKARYPQLSDQIDKGLTVEDVFGAYRTDASRLLGVDPNTIDLADSKWQTALQVPDSSKGGFRQATAAEWETMLRTDSRYGYAQSQNGRNDSFDIGQAVDKAFGRVA